MIKLDEGILSQRKSKLKAWVQGKAWEIQGMAIILVWLEQKE